MDKLSVGKDQSTDEPDGVAKQRRVPTKQICWKLAKQTKVVEFLEQPQASNFDNEVYPSLKKRSLEIQ